MPVPKKQYHKTVYVGDRIVYANSTSSLYDAENKTGPAGHNSVGWAWKGGGTHTSCQLSAAEAVLKIRSILMPHKARILDQNTRKLIDDAERAGGTDAAYLAAWTDDPAKQSSSTYPRVGIVIQVANRKDGEEVAVYRWGDTFHLIARKRPF